jgi:hypothetical protein
MAKPKTNPSELDKPENEKKKTYNPSCMPKVSNESGILDNNKIKLMLIKIFNRAMSSCRALDTKNAHRIGIHCSRRDQRKNRAMGPR